MRPSQDDPETMWSLRQRVCLLSCVGGHYELQLREKDHVLRIYFCPDERTGRRRAAEWQTLYDGSRDE